MSTPVITASSSMAVSVSAVGVSATLTAPTHTFLSMSAGKTALLGAGVQYTVSVDPSGLVSGWAAVSSANVSQVALSAALDSATWVGASAAACAYAFDGAPRSVSVHPGYANGVLGASGLAQHALLLDAVAFAGAPALTAANVLAATYGSSLAAVTAGLNSTLAAAVTAALQDQAAQQAVLQGLVSAAGAILDLSAAGTRTLALDAAMPDLYVTMNLANVSFDHVIDGRGRTRTLTFSALPIALYLT